MDWITKLERKFGKYAIKNLTLYIVSAYVIGYLIMKMAPELYFYLTLEPGYIMKGQVWRLVTWILIPPTGDIISMLFLVLCYYSIGGLLEQTWGLFAITYIFSAV